MTAKQLIEKLQALDPATEVLVRTVTGADYETDWETVERVDDASHEVVFVEREGKIGYHKVLCARLYEF